MNYYERHLGDYARDAGHLTMLEHGAYTLLLDRYYTTESGIPADQAHRVARARTKEEKQAVDDVLSEFFSLQDGLWIKNRVQEEITKAQTKIKAAQENGKKGGRPRNNQTKTQEKPNGLSLGLETETQEKAHQTPDTNISTSQSSARAPERGKFQMHADWNPSEHMPSLAKQAMVEINPENLAEFIAYWLTQPHQRSQAEWDKALLQSAKHNSLRAESGQARGVSRKPENFDQRDYGIGVTAL